ncbi:MAG TPA: 2-amino-4-hydroxy-6-hydroxymethyldihydropteridine diphosphokinase [Flavobacteriaceae bacterium]|nr:2-amino-4-hydroxy-6-hydroxymethyldihydropteridine diphosphokinase [Flavobacteriaceae bacterium]
MNQEKKVYISLGSNLGDRLQYLQNATHKIHDEVGPVLKISSDYESRSWGFEGDDFLNRVILVETHLTPQKVLKKLLEIENFFGRVRTAETGYQSRPIDLDILFYENKIISHKYLKIPHPQLHNRNFVLVPLCEIAPELVHPVFEKNITRLLVETPDNSEVQVYEK